MITRKLCASFVTATMIMVPVQRAHADDAAALLGGALIGGIIVNEVHKNKQRQAAQRSAARSSAAQREQNRQVQVALNYFGYNVGYADGVLGRNSRAGISRFQAEMGYAVDGYLDDHERNFLLGSHQRALASAHTPPYAQIVATQGQAGLLRTYRNEQLGIVTPQTQMAVTPAPAPVPAPAPSQPEPVTARADTSGGSLPQFGFDQAGGTARDHCDQINVQTAANGGLATAEQMPDPVLALNEQFCLARSTAMAESARFEAMIPNMTPAQIETQCDGLAQAIAPQLQGLDATPPDQVIARTSAFLRNSGQPMAQLVSGGKLCLGVGYRIDDAEVALASAVLLASAGQGGYAEIVGHHLREGLGTAQAATPQSVAWMNIALNAANSASAPVLGQTAPRVAVLQAATSAQSAMPVFPTVSGN